MKRPKEMAWSSKQQQPSKIPQDLGNSFTQKKSCLLWEQEAIVERARIVDKLDKICSNNICKIESIRNILH